MILLQNGQLTATVSPHGAELQSLRAASGIDYLWNGDPVYWAGRAPHLFPCVGRLRGGAAQSASGPVRLPIHGFARSSDFAVESRSDTAAVFRLSDTPHTRELYPYAFTLWVRITLDGAALRTVYEVHNPGDCPLPFCIGGHPAFRVPLLEGERFEDYAIEFEYPETADCPQVDLSTGLIVDRVRNRLLTDSRGFSLNHVLFRGDALIFDRLRSRRVRLGSGRGGHGVEMELSGLPFLGIWSPAHDSPFVCLEPWAGMATCESEDDVFEHKRGITILPPGGRASFAYTVRVF